MSNVDKNLICERLRNLHLELLDSARSARIQKSHDLIAAVEIIEESARPVPMILFCPMCHTRHVEQGTYQTKPHHTHACQQCGFVWRPAIADTIGVQFLPGFKD